MSTIVLATAGADAYVPHIFWVWPFAAILLAIAILPLLHKTHHWWENNRNKLLIALILSAITLLYYGFRGQGVAVHAEPAVEEVEAGEAVLDVHKPAEKAEAAHAAAGEHATAESAPTTQQEEIHAATEPAEHAAHAAHRTDPGLHTVWAVIEHAVLAEYIPFIVLLFCLYVIAGGIVVRGDIQATPLANTTIIGLGGLLASFIGTTGSAMLLIRLLLKTNLERRRKVHTVVFFIIVAANVGGSLLPIGDPPLFLGYLRGVPFLWTLNLWKYWLFMLGILLVVYFVWDTWAYRHESKEALQLDRTQLEPLRVAGIINVLWLIGVVLAVALLVPEKKFLNTEWVVPNYFREGVQLVMAMLSWVTTQLALRKENQFNFVAIGEVAALFIGIFIAMQVPIEILHARGAELGLTKPWQFFWATGILSSFLDNAPTYVVYFETAVSLPTEQITSTLGAAHMVALPGGRDLPYALLAAISCGAVFMGANTYIGNGPNFMVKAIAEQSGVKMPSFFGYMLYSCLILIPLFLIMTFVFFR